MSTPLRPSRRRFLQYTALAAAGPMIVRPHVVSAAADGTVAPSNRITIGIIGPGKQGTSHVAAIARRKDVAILGVCDVQESKRQKARETIEKGAAAATKEPPKKAGGDIGASSPWDSAAASSGGGSGTDPKAVKYYNDFRELLDRPDVDAVLIATPDHWHAVQVVMAAKAGKDIYCEKPLTLTIGEAKECIRVVRQYGRVFQVGSQQRSAREFRFAAEMIRNGRIGKVKTVTTTVGGPAKERDLPAEPVREGVDWDLWVGPAPMQPFSKTLCPGPEFDGFPNWRSYRDFSGGGMTDWGAHHFDITQWALGMDDSGPTEIIPPTPDRNWLTFRYASGVELYQGKTGGGKGIVFEGTEGTIEVARGYLQTTPDKIMRTNTLPGEVHLYNSPGHHEDFFRAVRERRDCVCPVEVGARSVSVCHLGNIASWLGRPLKWDPQNWTFVDDAEANRWIDRPRRGPWQM